MKMLKVWPIVLMFALIINLVGCASGGSDNPANNNANQPANTGNAGTTAPEEKAEDPKTEDPKPEPIMDFGGKPLRIGQWWGMDAYLNDEEKALQKKVEEKYNTKIEYVTVTDTTARLITSSVAGEPFADIVMIPLREAFPKLVVEGYVQPIDDVIDLSLPAFSENLVTMTNGKFQDKQYGISEPYAESHGLYYDKTLLQKLGLPDPYELQEKGEWTWDQFLEILKSIKAGGKVPLHVDSESLLASILIYTNEGKIEDDTTNTIALDSPNTMEALQFYNDLYNVHKVIHKDEQVAFGDGGIAFVNGYRWDNLGYVKDKPNDIGYVYFPKGPKATEYVVPYDKMNLWYIPKGVKNAEAVLSAFSELFEFDVKKGKDIKLQKEEPNMKNKESLDTMRKMFDSTYKIINYKAYVGLSDVVEEAFMNIASGKESPTTAIERIKPMAQGAIDVSTKK
ncbi:ABC transporter substrate-binding protein [Paenibacillus mendelii]|uniref:ABC transporter substrate-binding protein n=1 Tax=Paenibacillus mendelii TaxID=206163 RepID=A0ABV6J7Z4_9BACL|nr:extracellular solute-binding protein [Paenibacillus mendelii]MCQ6561337.1 extracellular solute-binding protein [Paenibacillus mendelii]